MGPRLQDRKNSLNFDGNEVKMKRDFSGRFAILFSSARINVRKNCVSQAMWIKRNIFSKKKLAFPVSLDLASGLF
jgi:hypothetical protein